MDRCESYLVAVCNGRLALFPLARAVSLAEHGISRCKNTLVSIFVLIITMPLSMRMVLQSVSQEKVVVVQYRHPRLLRFPRRTLLLEGAFSLENPLET